MVAAALWETRRPVDDALAAVSGRPYRPGAA